MTEEVFFDRTWEPLLFYLHLTGDFVFFSCFFSSLYSGRGLSGGGLRVTGSKFSCQTPSNVARCRSVRPRLPFSPGIFFFYLFVCVRSSFWLQVRPFRLTLARNPLSSLPARALSIGMPCFPCLATACVLHLVFGNRWHARVPYSYLDYVYFFHRLALLFFFLTAWRSKCLW